MDTHANRQRLLDAGFTERQTEAILEVLDRATGQVVTRDFLDDRLGRHFQLTREYLDRRLLETSEHVDAVLASGLQRQKRELLARGWSQCWLRSTQLSSSSPSGLEPDVRHGRG